MVQLMCSMRELLEKAHAEEDDDIFREEVDDEEFERPDTATSLSKIVERVKLESTPTAEKDMQLGSVTEEDYGEAPTPPEKDFEMSFSPRFSTWEPPRLSGR